ncbi:NADH dehydrogenase [ubiquinone] 1 alpha subcomplex subunit 13 [Diachasma alloeum]|uniref:NADH dehydrogenase [ubiquinone] 1 alpha subcomplex subunit 13 n=1 Tax=Diachasma alloeum TaxID=454923 RepID=A0A4E0RYX1_9HYME|nr:NADH dehydrogenase [ubiquinone] 1 alpha subcomplex subunit 13 [Diachasma alloeum]THK33001.1 B16.6 subunit, NADH-dehydrogenase [Diachasma alloeum]
MASKPKSGPQDMPPKGGFSPIQTARVNVRRIISPTIASALTVASISFGFLGFTWAYRDFRRETIEMNSARNVVWCMLLAERDRAFLKQMRINREEERDLMKDYPGWVVGTYFGEQIFEGTNPEELFEPTFHEYAVHASVNDISERFFRYLAT